MIQRMSDAAAIRAGAPETRAVAMDVSVSLDGRPCPSSPEREGR